MTARKLIEQASFDIFDAFSRPALLAANGRSLSYGSLLRQINSIAGQLRALGTSDRPPCARKVIIGKRFVIISSAEASQPAPAEIVKTYA